MKDIFDVPKITTLYGHNKADGRLEADWGFSVRIEYNGKKILFGTGRDGSILLGNMKKLGVSPVFDIIVISKWNKPHTGGLLEILSKNRRKTVYGPKPFPKTVIKKCAEFSCDIVEVTGETEITDDMTFFASEDDEEMFILLKTPDGVAIVSGCAHGGIEKPIKRAQWLFDSNVFMVVGGLHLSTVSDTEVREAIETMKKFGISRVSTFHCSGDRTCELMAEAFGKGYIPNGLGEKICIESEMKAVDEKASERVKNQLSSLNSKMDKLKDAGEKLKRAVGSMGGK